MLNNTPMEQLLNNLKAEYRAMHPNAAHEVFESKIDKFFNEIINLKK